MASPIEVRPYRADDRAAVRQICHLTGYMGDPISWQWRDEQSFADLFSSYYTDREPESSLVAELDGRVVGYLLGCRSTARIGDPLRPLYAQLVNRGLLVRRGTAGVLWRSGWDGMVEVAHRRPLVKEPNDAAHPAHLHINLLPEARGRGVGRRLVSRWFASLTAGGVPGCQLGTWAENRHAIAFFRSVGFRALGPPINMPGMRSPSGARHHVLWMATELPANPSS